MSTTLTVQSTFLGAATKPTYDRWLFFLPKKDNLFHVVVLFEFSFKNFTIHKLLLMGELYIGVHIYPRMWLYNMRH